MTDDATLQDHQRLIAQLRRPSAYAHPVDAIQLTETHISSVLLAGPYAYKLKKPVNLGFADFSTLPLRRRYCEEEIRLNRRSAPTLYLDVVAVTQSADGTASFDDHGGRPIDYAVRMRRFDEHQRFDRVVSEGRAQPAHVDAFAAAVAALHRSAALPRDGEELGSASEIRRWVSDNLRELNELAGLPGLQPRIARLADWTAAEFERRADTFTRRRSQGFVRECHGDLHLGNVVLVDDRPVPFDCIEFNPQLRFVDVISDVAFAWMDLLRFGEHAFAARFLNRYIEVTGDYAGAATLRFYGVYRALVRAKVSLIQRAQPHEPGNEGEQAADTAEGSAFGAYLSVAEQIVEPTRPQLVLTCGVSAVGKTTVSQHLLEALGAVRVRSDVERKRLVGVAAGERRSAAVGRGIYDAVTSRATYGLLEEAARFALDAGFPAIVDATFLLRDERRPFAALAAQLGVPFSIVLCEAPLQSLRHRITARSARGDDASDATLEVLAHQLDLYEKPSGDEMAHVHRIATDTDFATLAQRCSRLAAVLRASIPRAK